MAARERKNFLGNVLTFFQKYEEKITFKFFPQKRFFESFLGVVVLLTMMISAKEKLEKGKKKKKKKKRKERKEKKRKEEERERKEKERK